MTFDELYNSLFVILTFGATKHWRIQFRNISLMIQINNRAILRSLRRCCLISHYPNILYGIWRLCPKDDRLRKRNGLPFAESPVEHSCLVVRNVLSYLRESLQSIFKINNTVNFDVSFPSEYC